jgi:hypothetical protein
MKRRRIIGAMPAYHDDHRPIRKNRPREFGGGDFVELGGETGEAEGFEGELDVEEAGEDGVVGEVALEGEEVGGEGGGRFDEGAVGGGVGEVEVVVGEGGHGYRRGWIERLLQETITSACAREREEGLRLNA